MTGRVQSSTGASRGGSRTNLQGSPTNTSCLHVPVTSNTDTAVLPAEPCLHHPPQTCQQLNNMCLPLILTPKASEFILKVLSHFIRLHVPRTRKVCFSSKTRNRQTRTDRNNTWPLSQDRAHCPKGGGLGCPEICSLLEGQTESDSTANEGRKGFPNLRHFQSQGTRGAGPVPRKQPPRGSKDPGKTLLAPPIDQYSVRGPVLGSNQSHPLRDSGLGPDGLLLSEADEARSRANPRTAALTSTQGTRRQAEQGQPHPRPTVGATHSGGAQRRSCVWARLFPEGPEVAPGRKVSSQTAGPAWHVT